MYRNKPYSLKMLIVFLDDAKSLCDFSFLEELK